MTTSLEALRGAEPPVNHNARTIAALAANPGCSRRAVMDAAGIDKDKTAQRLGYPVRVGQSVFAITRARSFEALVKANGGAELLRLLREVLGLQMEEVAFHDLAEVGGNTAASMRQRRTAQVLTSTETGTLFDHPLLPLEVAGARVYLEPDVIAFQTSGRYHVVAIKSFPVIDGQADPGQVAAAAREAAVYVHALGEVLGDRDRVSHEVVLVCPENFASRPVATLVDVRKQLGVLRRQLSRLKGVEELLPKGVRFDLEDHQELERAVQAVEARFAPECMAACEMAFFCRQEAGCSTDRLGRTVRDELGGIDTVEVALALADGTGEPETGQEDIADLLRFASRIRREAGVA